MKKTLMITAVLSLLAPAIVEAAEWYEKVERSSSGTAI